MFRALKGASTLYYRALLTAYTPFN